MQAPGEGAAATTPARSRPAGRSALLERDSQLERLGAALDESRAGHGRLVVVEGHGGLGKSQLLGAARGFARGTGMAVLDARASELERDFAFGVALQLLEPIVAGSAHGDR